MSDEVRGLPEAAAWWKLNEGHGTTAADSSGHGHELKLEGGASWNADTSVTPPRVSLSLNGNGQFAQSARAVVDTAEAYTVCGWVWVDPAEHDKRRNLTALTQDGSANAGFGLQLRSTPEWSFFVPVNDTGYPESVRATDRAVTFGRWVHLAGVHDKPGSDTMTIYVDGTRKAEVAHPPSWKAEGRFAVGRVLWDRNHQDWWNGRIRDVRVFQTALTQDQVRDVYLADVFVPDPVAWWPMDDGEGKTARDESGRGHPLALIGQAGWYDDDLAWPPVVSMSLDGYGHAESAEAVLDTAASYTVSAWVWDATRGAGSIRTAMSQDGSAFPGFQLQGGLTHEPQPWRDRWRMVMLREHGGPGDLAVDPTEAVTGQWVHLAGVVDRAESNTIAMYVDGVLKQRTAVAIAPWQAKGRVQAGRTQWDGKYQDFWDGRLRDIRLYQTALNSDQVMSVYQSGKPVTPAVPVGTGSARNGTFASFSVSDKVSAQVNVGNGNLLVTTADLAVPQVSGSLTLGVAYNSLLTETGFPVGTTGNGWRQRLGGDVRVYQAPDGNMVFFGPDGACGTFKWNGSGYTSPPTFHVFLDKSGSGWKMTWYDTGATWEFNDHGRLTSITDRNKNKTAIEYNTGGYQTKLTCTPNGAKDPVRTVEASWTGIYLTKLTWHGGDSGTREVSYQVSSTTGNLESLTQPDGTTIRFGYNSSNDLTSITNGKDATTSIEYDSRHRVTSVSQPMPDGSHTVTRFGYLPGSRTLKAGPQTDQSQPVTGVPHVTYQVDSATSLVTSVTDQEGYAQSINYTPFGDVAAVTNALGATTTAGYNANAGRSLTAMVYPTGVSASLGYGNSPSPENPTAAYQPSKSVDTMGNATAYTYAGPGNLVEATSALPAKAKVKYNSDGTPESSTDPGNGDNATTYHYTDARQLARIVPVKDSSLRERTFTYDGFGRLRTASDGAGNTVTYKYDGVDRVTEAAYAGEHPVTVAYGYDKAGNLTTRTDPHGTTTWDYDRRNKPTSRTSSHGGGTQAYKWGRCGNLAEVSDASGATSYVYDTRGLLTALTDPAGNQWAFSYDANGNRTQTLFGITPASWAGQLVTRYDSAGRITRIQASRRTTAGQVTVTDTTYSYSYSGRETGLVHSATNNLTGVSLVHSYDKGRRLVKSTNVIHGRTYEYEYDTNGSLTTLTIDGHKTTWKHNPASQITGDGHYSYDGAGNQTGGPAAGTLKYNAAGQMISATRNGEPEETFTYAGADQTELLSSGTATAIAYGISGLRSYIPAGSTVPVYILRDQTGSLLGLVRDKHCYSYATDHLGNVAAIIGSDGTTQAGYIYDPYGTLVDSSGPLADTNLLRYLGALADPAGGKPGGSGWTHLGYRWLNHSDGRFTQQDTIIRIADPANANLYAYAADNPINYTDPTGQWISPVTGCADTQFGWFNTWFGGTVGAIGGAIFAPANSLFQSKMSQSITGASAWAAAGAGIATVGTCVAGGAAAVVWDVGEGLGDVLGYTSALSSGWQAAQSFFSGSWLAGL